MSAEQIAEIIAAVDYTTVIGGIVGIAAAVAVVYVAMKGAKMIISMLRG